MASVKSIAVGVLVAAGTSCASDLLTPTPGTLEGTWRTVPQAIQPTGNYTRELVFSAAGRYVATTRLRGTYAGLPSDSVISFESQFGRFILAGNALHMVQDSAHWLTCCVVLSRS